MTNSEIQRIPFDKGAINVWAQGNPKYSNWPVVYTIFNDKHIYVGETTNAQMRMFQHRANPDKGQLTDVNVIIHDDFNKSACLDLESHLIKYFAADEKFIVMNGNSGITESDYFQRDEYRKSFDAIFVELQKSGAFTRSIPDIVNSDLFKYSPFKALNTDQAIAIDGILDQLFQELGQTTTEPIVVQGEPGTGKTIVAVYLMKLLADIKNSNADDVNDVDSLFSDFFQAGYRELLSDLEFALVIPQISLRKSIRKVFSRTPGLTKEMVISPFELRNVEKPYDLLIVDETHRLQQRANQSSAANNILYAQINEKFFGSDDKKYTQLDWIKAASRNQILLLDEEQTVKPADLPSSLVQATTNQAKSVHSYFKLTSQMRVEGGEDYIDFISRLFSNQPPEGSKSFGNYEFKIFNSFVYMQKAIIEREQEHKLARVLAGYAWPWISKNGKAEFDFEIEGVKCIWNRTDQDWINSSTSIGEIGSIHTVQGYDLNYAAVIIGPELSFDTEQSRFVFKRENYHDKKGKENNPTLGRDYNDEDLLRYVLNIYRVLSTRGIKGTFIYAVDPEVKRYLEKFQ